LVKLLTLFEFSNLHIPRDKFLILSSDKRIFAIFPNNNLVVNSVLGRHC